MFQFIFLELPLDGPFLSDVYTQYDKTTPKKLQMYLKYQ